MDLIVEAVVVFIAATLAAGALTAAYNFVGERQWDAAVFLALAATASVWYGVIALYVVRAAFAA